MFNIILSYLVSSKPAWAMLNPVSGREKKLPEKSWARQISSDILSAEPTASEQN